MRLDEASFGEGAGWWDGGGSSGQVKREVMKAAAILAADSWLSLMNRMSALLL